MAAHTMASSSAHDAKKTPKPLRKRTENTAYHMPGPMAPRFIICDRHGPPLESTLIPLARALILFDLLLAKRVQKFHQKGALSADEIRKAKARRWIDDYNDINQQWKDIDSGQCNFSELYLKGNGFIPIWKEGMRIIREVLKSNQVSSNQSRKRVEYARILGEYESQADNLQTQIADIAHRGLFDPDFLNPIQERWMRLDETLELHYHMCNLCVDEDEPRVCQRSLKWPEVRSLIQVDDAGTKRDHRLGQTQLASRPRKATEPDTTAGSKIANAFTLWLVVFSCAVAPAALFALGYSRSLHLQGTADDADFWFLVQATLVQAQGLVVSALLERKRGRLPKWRWAFPAAIAAACSIAAIPLYLTVPKEWSAFVSLVAGITQSFMMLQLFLF